MRWERRAIITLGLVLLLSSTALAQQEACPAIVETALAATDELCSVTGRNQVCYGHFSLTAEAQPEIVDFSLDAEGDIVDVAGLKTLQLRPMDEATGEWGVALMRLQANIPDTLPGQNVTFLLFGDVELTGVDAEDAPPGARPMQAFYLRTGVADSGCDEAPESGLLVQTPDGVDEIAFNINGVDVQMGSTVLFQGNEDEDMSVSVLEGAALISSGDGQQVIPAGTWARVPLRQVGRRLLAQSAPQIPESYEGRQAFLQRLPLRLLQRKIEVKAALTEEQITFLHDRIQAGELPCGEDPLPSCDRLRRFLLNRARVCLALPPGRRPEFCGDLREFLSDIQATRTAEDQLTVTLPPGRSAENAYTVNFCQVSSPPLYPGQVVHINYGVGRWPSRAEARIALAGQTATITIDGIPLDIEYDGIQLHTGGDAAGYGLRALADWVALPGEHTLVGVWTIGHTITCTLVVEPQ
ncbi:MAG: hypothetical protein H6672_14225 [Anaerolineaceae bacterium]|nr:hypothetical protein [Anaerolineaceae bacterium]